MVSGSRSGFQSLLCVCVLSLSLLCIDAQTNANLLVPVVDRNATATSARIRWLAPDPSLISETVLQFTTIPSHFSSLTRQLFYTCYNNGDSDPSCNNIALSRGTDDVQITKTEFVNTYDVTGLKPATQYYVRLAAKTSSGGSFMEPSSTGTASWTTQALSASTSLTSLIASDGCGSLISGQLLYLRSLDDGTTSVYECDVVSGTSQVILSLVPSSAYATIDNTNGDFTNTSLPVTVTSTEVDPRKQYTHNITLGQDGTTTNYTFTVIAQNGTTKAYRLSIYRAIQSGTSDMAGASDRATAMIKSPAVATVLTYRALLWANTQVGPSSWRVWSDDLRSFPFSAFSFNFLTSDYSVVNISVTPAVANTVPGTCSNVHVAFFDTVHKQSRVATTCVYALNDDCSATPYGAATAWTTYYSNGSPQSSLLHFPPQPTPTFPVSATIPTTNIDTQ